MSGSDPAKCPKRNCLSQVLPATASAAPRGRMVGNPGPSQASAKHAELSAHAGSSLCDECIARSFYGGRIRLGCHDRQCRDQANMPGLMIRILRKPLPWIASKRPIESQRLQARLDGGSAGVQVVPTTKQSVVSAAWERRKGRDRSPNSRLADRRRCGFRGSACMSCRLAHTV